jgi:hypothetical protein
MFESLLTFLGKKIATYLSKPLRDYETFGILPSLENLQHTIKPGDILLVEGDSRLSSAIQYLTQSTWSHACFYIGDRLGHHTLIETNLLQGVVTVPLEKYKLYNTRICRPVKLSPDEINTVIEFMIQQIGDQYDLKNIIDLMRYLVPIPLPIKNRRRFIAYGSGDPTKSICSSLIAEAFQTIKYPILPRGEVNESKPEIIYLKQQHYSHFVPRDFDVSPYFEIVKPTLAKNFDPHHLKWEE